MLICTTWNISQATMHTYMYSIAWFTSKFQSHSARLNIYDTTQRSQNEHTHNTIPNRCSRWASFSFFLASVLFLLRIIQVKGNEMQHNKPHPKQSFQKQDCLTHSSSVDMLYQLNYTYQGRSADFAQWHIESNTKHKKVSLHVFEVFLLFLLAWVLALCTYLLLA